MTPRQRVETVLRGGTADKVPFTMYEAKVPQCTVERNLRNRGLCIVKRIPVYSVYSPNVKESSYTYHENGRTLIRTHYETPVGTVTRLQEPAGFTTWIHEKLFKTPDDYKVIEFMMRDMQFEECYDNAAKMQEAAGEDIIFRAGFGLEPLQMLISGGYLDMQTFCMEWMDNRDEILKIYDVIVEKRRASYEIVAKSPCSHANYGGNVVAAIIGVDTFEKYYVPHYNEAAEVMHKHGKLIGCHFDDNCKLLAEAIAGTDLDYIEAFTPAPDTDMTLGEARQAWPDKILWLNYPSSMHLKSDAEVTQYTVDMLKQPPSPAGIIMGITEDIPEERWRDSCTAIMDGLDRHAAENPSFYAITK
jgi:hypothetical protein